MPIPKDYEEIITMLANATAEGRVRWKTTSSNGIRVSIPPSQFDLWAGTDDETGQGFVAFALREGKALLDNWNIDEGDTAYWSMRDLYQTGRRQALGVPAKLQALKDRLATFETIGDEE